MPLEKIKMDVKIYYGQELYHHGTKGQKWYRRLYQNEDGSLTALGKVRYGSKSKKSSETQKTNEMTDEALKSANTRSALENTYNKNHPSQDHKTTEKMKTVQEIANNSSNLANNVRTGTNAASNLYRSNKKSVDMSNMTNKELQDYITRSNLERQYVASLPKDKVEKGLDNATNALQIIGSVAAVTASGIGIAVGIRTLAGKG